MGPRDLGLFEKLLKDPGAASTVGPEWDIPVLENMVHLTFGGEVFLINSPSPVFPVFCCGNVTF